MASAYIVAIDQGTSSSRTVIFDEAARPVASAQQEFPQIYPQPGWVEHDPEQIWGSVLDVSKAALSQIDTAASAWPVLVSRINVRRRSFGIGEVANVSTMRLSGRIGAPRTIVAASGMMAWRK